MRGCLSSSFPPLRTGQGSDFLGRGPEWSPSGHPVVTWVRTGARLCHERPREPPNPSPAVWGPGHIQCGDGSFSPERATDPAPPGAFWGHCLSDRERPQPSAGRKLPAPVAGVMGPTDGPEGSAVHKEGSVDG